MPPHDHLKECEFYKMIERYGGMNPYEALKAEKELCNCLKLLVMKEKALGDKNDR